MFTSLFTSLIFSLGPHFQLSKTRLETLAVLITGIVNCRTVNLSHLASQFPGSAFHASNYRRLQRFFQHVDLDQMEVAQIVVRMLKLVSPHCLVLDRTNWKVGSRDINILVLAVVTQRFRVPLLWSLLDHSGNSSSKQRISLMQRYLSLFAPSSIEVVLADREFIGVEWIKFLCKNNIPFIIRLKQDMTIHPVDGGLYAFGSLLRKPRRGQWQGWLNGMEHINAYQLHFAGRKLKGGEILVIATNLQKGARALNIYRKRWAIECMFGDTKTRGLNMEDTHMVDPGKLSTLLAVVTLAITWAYRCTTTAIGIKAIRKKAHGRREKSYFRVGLDALRNWIIYKPDKAIDVWIKSCPKTKIIQ